MTDVEPQKFIFEMVRFSGICPSTATRRVTYRTVYGCGCDHARHTMASWGGGGVRVSVKCVFESVGYFS